MTKLSPTTSAYHQSFTASEKKICLTLRRMIRAGLPKTAEEKIWHGSPVWFLEGNPIVGYSKLQAGIQLMFWSGWSFDEPKLQPIGNVKKFKAAGVMYTAPDQVIEGDIRRWLRLAKRIQWDYKNIVKRKGKLIRLSKG